MNKTVKKSLKVLAWIVGIIIGLFLLIVLLLQVPAIQNVVKKKAVSFIEGKIHTPVSIDRLEIGLPKKIVLSGFYFEDQEQDTLIYGKRLAIDISLFKLISSDVEINSIELEGTQAYVKRNKDSVFNFDYIIEAFATPTTDTTATSTITLGDIALDQIKFKFEDAITKTNIDLQLQHFDTYVETFDLDKMNFSVPDITIDGLTLRVYQDALATNSIATPSEENSSVTDSTAPFNINLEDIRLSNIDIKFNSQQSKMNAKIALKELSLDFDDFNFADQNVVINDFEVDGLNGNVLLLKDEKLVNNAQDSTATSAPILWKVAVAETNLSNINFKFKDENAKPVEEGIDYMDLELTNINLEADDLEYTADRISGAISAFTMKDKSGLYIKSLHTDFLYASTSSYLKDLYIETPESIIRKKVVLGYPSLEAMQDDPGTIEIDAEFEESKIAFQDILILAPELKNTNPFQSNPNAVLYVNGKISGKLNDLKVEQFSASGIGSTSVSATGTIKGLPDVENARFNLNISEFTSTAQDIKEFVPEGTIPSNITLPKRMNLKGSFAGSMQNFKADLKLKSSSGDASFDGNLDMRTEGNEIYDGNLKLSNFDVGRLIQNDSIGVVSMNAKVRGRGLDPKTATASASGTITKAQYNSYNYKDLKFEGDIAKGDYNLKAGMNDPNLDFDLNASGSFSGEHPSLNLETNLNNVGLDSLNLYGTPLRFTGKIKAALTSADPDYLNGKVYITDLVIDNVKKKFPLDTISLTAVSKLDSTSLVLESQLVEASIKGQFQLTKIGGALTRSLSHYYEISTVADTATIKNQNFGYKLKVQSDPLLTQIMPALNLEEPLNISGRFNSVNDTIVMVANFPRMDYLDYKITNGALDIHPEGNALTYDLTIGDVDSPQIKLPYTSLTGKVENNMVDYNLRIDNSKGQPHYQVAGTMETSSGNMLFSLDPKNLLLDYENWSIPQDNQIMIASNGVLATNFNLSHNNSAIKINSQTQDPASPLNIDFESFKIETISAMISKDTLLMGGQINGELSLADMFTKPKITSDLNIANFNFKKDTVGDIRLRISSQTPTLLNTNINITGQGNQVDLTGTYETTEGSLNMNLDIKTLNVKSIQGFSFGAISESTGNISGNFDISGTVAEPNIIGRMKFNEVGFLVNQLNANFHTMNDWIAFDEKGMNMSTFTLFDEDDNKLVIDGSIATTDYTSYNFDLDVTADNFHAVNSTVKDNDFYYGDLYLDSNLKIGGSLESPVVSGTIDIQEDTDFTIVMPQPDPSIADREGVVEFVDEQSLREAQAKQMEAQFSNAELEGMDVSVNITVTDKSKFTLVIDEANGDFLNLEGNAQLSAGIDPSGKTSLTGRYELSDGAYEMSFNFIKRRFELEKGSYILWTGDPTNADINITAIYKSETAPIDLLDNQLSGLTPSARNIYKQKLPFQTKLNMKGELLEPIISFDIVLPEGNYNVASEVLSNTRAKLAQIRDQPSELNKQVFALLLLNRFIGENPFASEAGATSAGALARQSVSKILSQQLNDLAADLINGVQLNFDLESSEDYTTGQRENRTDLNVGVSKSLLNDRLKVTIGSSFGLEGPQGANQQSTNIAGDVAIDYMLSKDGRYLLRAYRKNQYEVAVQGQVVETGLSFIITMDYDRFRELFIGNKDKNKSDNK